MIDYDKCEIRPSKHFVLSWMRKWNFDIESLRDALKNTYKVDKVGKIKYEAYTRHGASGKSRKIIFVFYEEKNEIFIITGSEGK